MKESKIWTCAKLPSKNRGLEATALVLLLDNYVHYLLRRLQTGEFKGKHLLCVIVVGWPCVLFWLSCVCFAILCVFVVLCVYCSFFTLDAGLLARSQYSEGPATGHLDTGFSWFPCVYKQVLRWFPWFQVATTCFSRSPPDLNLLVINLMLLIHVK